MNDGRSYADALELNGEVWVTGGWDGKRRHASSEIMVGSVWNSGADMTGRRYQHCGVVLQDNTVVITGDKRGKQGKGKL